jgi:hypothetical protein
MNSRLLISLLCAGAVALACGSLSRRDADAAHSTSSVQNPSRATGSPTRARTHRTARDGDAPNMNGNFAVNVEPHALHFALNLTNASKKHVELSFPNGQQYEFIVLDSVGHQVYRWGAGRMFTQSMQNKLIDGENSMHIDERAEMTLPHGKYIAVATLRSSNFPMRQSSTFELR